MTFTLSTEHLYLLIIVGLMALQVYQFILINSIRKEIEDLWDQLGQLAMGVSIKIAELNLLQNKKSDGSQDKKA